MTHASPEFKPKSRAARLSMSSYMDMLNRARRKRATAAEMCAAIGRKKTTGLTRLVMWMLRLDILHIHSWTSVSGRGKLVGRFGFGHAESAEYPGKAGYQFGHNAIGRPPTSLIVLQHMLDVMLSGATTNQVVDATGLSRGVALRAIRHGRQIGLFMIGSYRRRIGAGGSPIPVYSIRQPGEQDAAPPTAIGSTRDGRNALARQSKDRNRIRQRIAGSLANNRRHLEAA